MRKIFLFILPLFNGVAWAGACPDLAGDYTCYEIVDDRASEYEMTVQNTLNGETAEYNLQKSNSESQIIADGIEHVTYVDYDGFVVKYVYTAVCDNTAQIKMDLSEIYFGYELKGNMRISKQNNELRIFRLMSGGNSDTVTQTYCRESI